MECPAKARESSQVLIDYCAGTLDAAAAAEVECHIEQCAACREFCRKQSMVWSALGDWEPAPVSASFDARLGARLEQADRGGWWASIWRPAVPLAAAAVVIAAVLLLRVPEGANPTIVVKKADTMDIDQVEKSLDDIDILKQLYLAPPDTAAGAEQL
ncbi:MAG: zf-HC2 domain-containing protein [Acidobacteriales bacterium]|nr:zf-HC2 domain-containing protein [Terriglobales bacterium]